MGRIIEYVVLLSNLSLVLGVVQVAKTFPSYGRDKQGNLTEAARQHLPREHNFFGRKILPPEPHNRRRAQPPKQMPTSLGLHAYASDDSDRNRKPRQPRRNLPPFSQGLYPRKNSKTFYGADVGGQKLSKLSDHNNSVNHHRPSDFGRRYQKEARRYHSPKICDPCNSVPWVPLLKVSDSYRQQRTHVTELHPAPQQNFNLDYHAYASDTHSILLPPVPLPPPVFDSTISSSFGLPIGNIPTSHGLLAPLHHLASDFSKYALNTIDYGSTFNYYSPHGLLESNNFPELSPVPVVPIHDSGQFHQFDSAVPDLVPPPPKDVSKVVLTISEEHKKNPNPSDFVSRGKEQNHGKDLGKLEIVKSIPLAEFTSSVKVPQQQQELPLYPPLQGEFSTEQQHAKKHSDTTSGFLAPPPVTLSSNKTTESSEYVAQATAPKPLTSPSLSWLFSDHTAPPKTTAPVSLPAIDAQEIASVVNNELLPASSHPLVDPGEQTAPKSKRIQIIIPYTTKGKSGHDNNAVESVQHEVFQPPRESATSALPPSTTQRPRQSEKTAGYITEMQHIIASNIRELLREEIDKTQKDQNYPLQNNIDNWTALEYSNHKTAGTKAPKEIIAQALAVTSIPGTSISHLLLPSKKIPNEYFVTTPLPVYDEPSTLVYKTHNTSVNSRPFTAKPYATTNVYNPRPGNVGQQPPGSNHEGNYTEVERGKVNIWGRLNENLVLPEARSRTTAAAAWPNSSEKIEIVTPVSVGQRNRTTAPFRRTTRHVRTTETPTADKFRLVLNNSTKLEKVSNMTSPLRGSSGNSSSGSNNNNNNSNSSISSNNNNSSRSNNNNSSSRSNNNSSGGSSSNSSGSSSSGSSGISSPEVAAEESVAGKGEHVSINDIFPFRNKELPWESGRNSSQPASRMERQRKSLIKQVKTQKTRAAEASS